MDIWVASLTGTLTSTTASLQCQFHIHFVDCYLWTSGWRFGRLASIIALLVERVWVSGRRHTVTREKSVRMCLDYLSGTVSTVYLTRCCWEILKQQGNSRHHQAAKGQQEAAAVRLMSARGHCRLIIRQARNSLYGIIDFDISYDTLYRPQSSTYTCVKNTLFVHIKPHWKFVFFQLCKEKIKKKMKQKTKKIPKLKHFFI